MGFNGSSAHTISDNGRVSIPSKMRDVLRRDYPDESMVLALGRDGDFLAAYPRQEWEKFDNALKPQNRREALAARRIRANTEDVSVDKQGRILISPALREKAGLSGECFIVGANNRIEIWNRSRWDAEMATELPDDGSDGLGSQFNELNL